MLSLLAKKQNKNFFSKYGFVVLRNALDNNSKKTLLKAAQDIEIDSLFTKDNNFLHNFEHDSYNNKKLCRSEDLLKHDGLNNFLVNDFLIDTASWFHGKNVTLFKEKINYKYPNTGYYKPHQDITAYPTTSKYITAVINLNDTDINSGNLEFASLSVNNIQQNAILNNINGVICDTKLLDWSKPLSTKFGDIILFDSYIPHRSQINKSNKARKTLYVTYNSLEDGYMREEYYKNKLNNLSKDKISFIDHYKGNIINKNLSHKKYVVDFIIDLYKSKGLSNYDEYITQNQHAFQSFNIAYNKKYTKELQLSAFLHDIGHLLLDENRENDNFLNKDLKHEVIAYRFLKNFFDKKVTHPILLHVMAKRYLCSIDKQYYHALSDGSKKSLEIQGGLLNEKEQLTFANNKYFVDAMNLRKIDDTAKVSHIHHTIDDFSVIENLLYDLIKI